MCEQQRSRSVKATIQSDHGLCYMATYCTESNDFVSRNRRPYTECAGAQADIGIFC